MKRLFGEHIITSLLVRTQNRELSFKCIAYNMHRLTNLTIISMVSTEPYIHKIKRKVLYLSLVCVNILQRRLFFLNQTLPYFFGEY